MNCNNCGI